MSYFLHLPVPSGVTMALHLFGQPPNPPPASPWDDPGIFEQETAHFNHPTNNGWPVRHDDDTIPCQHSQVIPCRCTCWTCYHHRQRGNRRIKALYQDFVRRSKYQDPLYYDPGYADYLNVLPMRLGHGWPRGNGVEGIKDPVVRNFTRRALRRRTDPNRFPPHRDPQSNWGILQRLPDEVKNLISFQHGQVPLNNHTLAARSRLDHNNLTLALGQFPCTEIHDITNGSVNNPNSPNLRACPNDRRDCLARGNVRIQTCQEVFCARNSINGVNGPPQTPSNRAYGG